MFLTSEGKNSRARGSSKINALSPIPLFKEGTANSYLHSHTFLSKLIPVLRPPPPPPPTCLSPLYTPLEANL